jgi:xanthine dehydrogenase YagS FAD-binding subunit
MRSFSYARASAPREATNLAAATGISPSLSATDAHAQYLAGGTTLIDLMKLDVMRPERIVDINALDKTAAGRIEQSPQSLRLGALVRMADAEGDARIRRDYPVVAQSLDLAASPQIRNMASLGGNVLQRTRCTYFRDVSYPNCNKRIPGSGCAALDGINRPHAILGVSEHCIATYPGDFAQALIALDAAVEIAGPDGSRTLPFAKLHRRPGETPHIETALKPGELITAFHLPAAPWFRRSLYLKIRDRESYEFALASAAVALDLEDGRVREARIALGGVATTPWRSQAAEASLRGKALDADAIVAAAEAAFADAMPREHNAFKIDLGKRTLARALHETAKLEL